MSSPSYTYTLTNGNTADASQVTQNFNDILNGVTDGTKDLNINALTVAGTATLNGAINLGNAAGDDITITGSLASSLAIKTNNAFDIGAATLGLRKLYLGNGGAGATCDIISASHATTREYTVPDCGAAAAFVMTQGTQTVVGATTFSGQLIGKGTTTNDTPTAGHIGEVLTVSTGRNSGITLANGTTNNICASAVVLTPGDWDVSAFYGINFPPTTSYTSVIYGLNSTTATLPAASTIGNPSAGLVRSQWYISATVPGDDVTWHMPTYQVTVASGASLSLFRVLKAAFTISSAFAYGYIQARRSR